jgi:hypothetical protein
MTHPPASLPVGPDTPDSPTLGEEDTIRCDIHPREHFPPKNPTPDDGLLLHNPRLPPHGTKITILTLNLQKVGNTSFSQTHMVTLLDLHTPDALLLTETPLHPHKGELTQILRNKRHKTHYHSMNTPSPKGTLPDARLPIQTTHNAGGGG